MSGFYCQLRNNQFCSDKKNKFFNRYYVVFAGEIYNKEECIKKLHTPLFADCATTEWMIAFLYDHYREAFVSHLRGKFAFVIWDEQLQTLFAARDPFGIQSLFYVQKNADFIFSTSKSKLQINGQPFTINQTALQHYLSFQYVPEPFSLKNSMEQVKALPPGYTLSTCSQSVALNQYSKLTFHPIKKHARSFTEATKQLLIRSIKSQVRNTDQVGIFLSGGIDSTSIAAIAKQFNPNIKTFTVGFAESGYTEIELAKATAHQLNVENVAKIITPEDVINILPQLILAFEEPIADPAAIPLFFAAQEARKHVNVVLTGEGADEIFGGYNVYREPYARRLFRYMPNWLNSILHRLALQLPEKIKGKNYLWRATTPIEARYIGNANIFNELEKQQLLICYNEATSNTDVTKELFSEAKMYDDSMKMQYIDLHTWLKDDILATANHIANSHKLQFRYPFLDKDLFNLARQIPTKAKLAKRTTKYVLRKAMEGIVPHSVLYRKKLGLPVPINHWLRNEMYEFAKDTIINSDSENNINKQKALALLDQHARAKHDHSRKLWTILIYMLWHRFHVDEKTELPLHEHLGLIFTN